MSAQDIAVRKIHLSGLFGFAAILVIIGLAGAAVLSRWAQEYDTSLISLHTRIAKERLDDHIADEVRLLESGLDLISSDLRLARPLAQRDAESLDRLARPLFERLRNNRLLSHLYFIGTDRKVVLRLHHPDVKGDEVRRGSMMDAEREQRRAWGFDLGIDGAMRLRVVMPWRDTDGNLLGYVEAAREAADVLSFDRRSPDNVLLLVPKAKVHRARWEEGQRALGAMPDWDLLASDVITAAPDPRKPWLDDLLKRRSLPAKGETLRIHDQGRILIISLKPIDDGRGGELGCVAIVTDLTEAHAESRRILLNLGLLLAGGGGAIIVLTHLGLRVLSRLMNQTDRRRREVEAAARLDSLTGALNRGEFDRRLRLALASLAECSEALGLMILDLDHFKEVNDTMGHPAGDAVLKAVARTVQSSLRPSDSFARMGGEEFGVILPGGDAETMRILSERILGVVEAMRVPVPGGEARITVSIGMVTTQAPVALDTFVADADRALYKAKENGRNRVEMVSTSRFN